MYNYLSSDPDKIIYSSGPKAKVWKGIVFFLSIALIGWVIHFFFPPAKEAAWVTVKFVLWIISGFFLLVMFIAPESRIDFPVNIVFDHRQGALPDGRSAKNWTMGLHSLP